jgi:two-component system, cell cycle sensor histidine kinase and response regulator CckA
MHGKSEPGRPLRRVARVLVVDDSEADFELCQILLESAAPGAYVLDWCRDFEQALSVMGREQHDLVLVDHGLGARSGVDLIRAAASVGCTTPSILFTGGVDPRVEREALAAGAVDFLTKDGLDQRRLERACRLTLERQRLLDQQRRSIQRLASKNEALRILLHAADGLVVCTLRGRILYLNPAAEALLGRPRTEAVGSYLPLELDELLQGTEVSLSRPHGGAILVSVNVSELLWDGEPSHLVSLRDVTASKRMQEQVHHAEKMALLGQIAGGIAHDFNNLMMAVVGSVEIARMDDVSPQDVDDHLERAEQAALRAADLTTRLLAVARRNEPEPQIFDLALLVNTLAPVLEGAATGAVSLTVTTDGPIWIYADPLELEQLTLNLVTNARDAAGEGGIVSVVVTDADVVRGGEARFVGESLPPGNYALLQVTDDGHGISPELQTRIFEPFFSTRTDGRGSGLGLAVVDRVVGGVGGGLRLESRPGRTRFDVLIPRAMEPSTIAPLMTTGSVRPISSLKILLADDEPAVRDVIASSLRRLGHNVTAASDGLHALQALVAADEPPDLLLTDVAMPGMDGFELAEAVLQQHPSLPVVFISGLAEELFERHGSKFSGEIHVLRKPFRLDQLLEIIELATGGGDDP